MGCKKCPFHKTEYCSEYVEIIPDEEVDRQLYELEKQNREHIENNKTSIWGVIHILLITLLIPVIAVFMGLLILLEYFQSK